VHGDERGYLLTHEHAKRFTTKPIAGVHRSTEVATALSVDAKLKGNELADSATKAGAKEAREPQDGFMVVRSFEDPDGHIWEVLWLDPAHIQQ